MSNEREAVNIDEAVRFEMQRVKRAMELSAGDKEDLITYAKEVVSLRYPSPAVFASRYDEDLGECVPVEVDPPMLAKVRERVAVERKAEPLEHVEKVSTEAAMSQWERSLKRPDLCEKDRVRGAIEAYKRQAFAFAISPTPPAAPVRGREAVAWIDDEMLGELAYALTKRLVIDMPTARAAVDEALRYFHRSTNPEKADD